MVSGNAFQRDLRTWRRAKRLEMRFSPDFSFDDDEGEHAGGKEVQLSYISISPRSITHVRVRRGGGQ